VIWTPLDIMSLLISAIRQRIIVIIYGIIRLVTHHYTSTCTHARARAHITHNITNKHIHNRWHLLQHIFIFEHFEDERFTFYIECIIHMSIPSFFLNLGVLSHEYMYTCFVHIWHFICHFICTHLELCKVK